MWELEGPLWAMQDRGSLTLVCGLEPPGEAGKPPVSSKASWINLWEGAWASRVSQAPGWLLTHPSSIRVALLSLPLQTRKSPERSTSAAHLHTVRKSGVCLHPAGYSSPSAGSINLLTPRLSSSQAYRPICLGGIHSSDSDQIRSYLIPYPTPTARFGLTLLPSPKLLPPSLGP